MKENKIACPFCGSNDIGFVTEEIGICRACLEKVVIEKPVEIVCSSCGSKNVNMVTEEVGICMDCMEKVVISKNKTVPPAAAAIQVEIAKEPAPDASQTVIASENCPSCDDNEENRINKKTKAPDPFLSNEETNNSNSAENVPNEVYIQTSNASPNEFMSNYVVKAEIDESTFLRDALYTLACNKETPPDIFSSEFLPVTSDYRFYSDVTCDVDLSYSATIGIDRKEEYREFDKAKNEWVTKTRTVTDWTPHSGVNKSSQHTAIPIDGGANHNFEGTLWAINRESIVRAEAVDFEAPSPQTPSQSDIDKAKRGCVVGAEYTVERNLPGDRHKDFNASGTASVTKIDNYVVPEYTMGYKYHYYTYSMHSFATQYNADWGEMVSAKKDIEKSVENNSFKYYVLTTGLLLLSIIISLTVRLYTLNIVFFALSFASFVFTAIFRSRTRKQIYADNAKEKLRTLDKLLADKGLEKLSESEKQAITEGKKQ